MTARRIPGLGNALRVLPSPITMLIDALVWALGLRIIARRNQR